MSSHTSSHEPSEHAASGNADARPGQAPGAGQAAAGRTPILPSAGAVIQSGAFGAALSGVTTAIADAVRVQAGEITKQEAAKDVARASLQGALTMAVASSVGHMVRARPVIGLAILAVAGVGALMMMGEKKRQPRRVAPPLPQPQAPAPATARADTGPEAPAAAAPAETAAPASPRRTRRRAASGATGAKTTAKPRPSPAAADAAPENTPAGS